MGSGWAETTALTIANNWIKVNVPFASKHQRGVVARQNSNCTSKVILKGVSPTEIGWVGGHGC
jgi:hypothetical protein